MGDSWSWVWMFCVFVFLLTPVSYGWAYRGWGPPYPRLIQRRRAQLASVASATDPASSNAVTSARVEYQSWGWGGDLVWFAFFVAVIWMAAAAWR